MFFWLNTLFFLPLDFDHNAFMHHTSHVLDAPVYIMTVRRPCSGMAVLWRQLQIVIIIITIIMNSFQGFEPGKLPFNMLIKLQIVSPSHCGCYSTALHHGSKAVSVYTLNKPSATRAD